MLGSVFASWYVELVFVVQSVCIRLVGKCGFESICPLLQYIQGKSILVFQYVPIYILLVCECVVGHTCSGCLCRLHSCHKVLECVVGADGIISGGACLRGFLPFPFPFVGVGVASVVGGGVVCPIISEVSVAIVGYANACSWIDCASTSAIVGLQVLSGEICGCVRVILSIRVSELEKITMSLL